MTEDELVAMYLLLLFGGSETTTNLLGNGFLALQKHRDQWDLLRRGPVAGGRRDGRADALRLAAPLPSPRGRRGLRAARHDATGRADRHHRDGGGQPRRGEVPGPGPARRDPGQQARAPVFAFGAHHCLGAALARLEGDVVFSTLLERFPDARLLDPDPRTPAARCCGRSRPCPRTSAPDEVGLPAGPPTGRRARRAVAGGLRSARRVDDVRRARPAGRPVRGVASAAGLVAGDRVLLLMPNAPETFELLVGCARAGLVAVPVNWRLAPERGGGGRC